MASTSTECGPAGTGWFGIPGANGRGSTKVHVVRGGKPACGSRLSPRQEYQWCAAGIVFEYLECEKCKGMARRSA